MQENLNNDVSEKNNAYQKYLTDKPILSTHLEHDQPSYSGTQICVDNPSTCCEKRDKNLNFIPKNLDNSGESILFPHDNLVYNMKTYSNRWEGEQHNIVPSNKLENECNTNRTSGSHGEFKNYQTPNKRIIYQNKLYEIQNNSSYICQPVNSKKETVRINDLVIKDNLILRCKPRKHYVPSLYTEPNLEDSGTVGGYFHPKTKEGHKIDDSLYNEKNYLYSDKPYLINLEEPALLRQDTLDPSTSLFHQEHSLLEKTDRVNKSVERANRCSKLSKKFKHFLWVLFFVNIFLTIIGLTLMIYVLSHFISRNYMNIVIEKTGFVIWIWLLMILSVGFVIVGIYGVFTSIDRNRKTLIAYCIAAFTLALLILVFTIFLWVMFVNMKDVQHSSMTNTFKQYRCKRYIRSAWDDLQEIHKCCGIEDERDWRYIPPSCCNATTKQQEMGCVKYFINMSQAFNRGCKSELEHYFTVFFSIAACFLLLGFLLLLLGIFATIWLLKKYTKIVKCQKIYYISR